MTRHSAAVSALLALAGCSPGVVSTTCPSCVDGGSAAHVDGGAHDGGVLVDGGSSSIDSGSGVDGGLDGGVDAGTPEVDAGTAPDSGPPIPSYAWVWIDRGGPAFQPHACRAGAGVVDGMLVDPMAFFTELVAGRDPDTWQTVMSDMESELWSCGVGQQRGSGGDVRGRLFLPTAACPDASPPPGDTTAMFLGVRQEPDCWSHPADVVEMR